MREAIQQSFSLFYIALGAILGKIRYLLDDLTVSD